MKSKDIAIALGALFAGTVALVTWQSGNRIGKVFKVDSGRVLPIGSRTAGMPMVIRIQHLFEEGIVSGVVLGVVQNGKYIPVTKVEPPETVETKETDLQPVNFSV